MFTTFTLLLYLLKTDRTGMFICTPTYVYPGKDTCIVPFLSIRYRHVNGKTLKN